MRACMYDMMCMFVNINVRVWARDRRRQLVFVEIVDTFLLCIYAQSIAWILLLYYCSLLSAAL